MHRPKSKNEGADLTDAVCVTAVLCHLSFPAVGGQRQETSALAAQRLAVLTSIQGHEGG